MIRQAKNVFDYLAAHGNDEHFLPSRKPTDPTIEVDYTDAVQFSARVTQMAERVERGEEVFHPDEYKLIPMKSSANLQMNLNRKWKGLNE